MFLVVNWLHLLRALLKPEGFYFLFNNFFHYETPTFDSFTDLVSDKSSIHQSYYQCMHSNLVEIWRLKSKPFPLC